MSTTTTKKKEHKTAARTEEMRQAALELGEVAPDRS